MAYDSYEWTGGHAWPVSFCIVALIFVAYAVIAAAEPGQAMRRLGNKPRSGGVDVVGSG